MLSSYNNLKNASLTELRIAEASLRSEMRNKSNAESVRKAASNNLKKVLQEIRKKS